MNCLHLPIRAASNIPKKKKKKVKLLLPIADKKGFRKGVDHATLNSPKNLKLLLLIGYKKGSRKGV